MALKIGEFCDYLIGLGQEGEELIATDTAEGREYAVATCKVGGNIMVQIGHLSRLCVNCPGCAGEGGLQRAFTKDISRKVFGRSRTVLEVYAPTEKS